MSTIYYHSLNLSFSITCGSAHSPYPASSTSQPITLTHTFSRRCCSRRGSLAREPGAPFLLWAFRLWHLSGQEGRLHSQTCSTIHPQILILTRSQSQSNLIPQRGSYRRSPNRNPDSRRRASQVLLMRQVLCAPSLQALACLALSGPHYQLVQVHLSLIFSTSLKPSREPSLSFSSCLWLP